MNFKKKLSAKKKDRALRNSYLVLSRSFFFALTVLTEAIASGKWGYIVHIVLSFLSLKKLELLVPEIKPSWL